MVTTPDVLVCRELDLRSASVLSLEKHAKILDIAIGSTIAI
jgi:hypothetical protein